MKRNYKSILLLIILILYIFTSSCNSSELSKPQTTETNKITASTLPTSQTTTAEDVTTSTQPSVIDPTKFLYKLSFDNITNISKSKNVFVFVIDRFDRVFAEAAFIHDPAVFSSLEGFTYFEDNISLYGHTYPSIAYMVTGNKLNEESRKDFLAKAYDNAAALDELKRNNYQVNVFTNSYYGYNTDYYVSKYISNAVDNKSDKAKYSTKLDGLEEFYKNAEFKLVDDKVYSFIHLEGCHDCYFGGGTAPEALKDTQVEKCLNSLKKNFAIINKYIEKMKEWGVYDNATIIITGDHGAAISDAKPLDGIRTTALFVKSSGSGKGNIVRSSSPVCHDNLWATIFKSEGINTSKSCGTSVFDAEESSQAKRTYLWHAFVKDEDDKTVYVEYKYTIIGSALDFNNWTLTETKQYDKSLYA